MVNGLCHKCKEEFRLKHPRRHLNNTLVRSGTCSDCGPKDKSKKDKLISE